MQLNKKKRKNVSIGIFIIWVFCILLYLTFIRIVKIPNIYSIFIILFETMLSILVWAFFMIKIDWLKDINTGKEIMHLNISNVLSAVRFTLVPLLITMFGLLIKKEDHLKLKIYIFIFAVLVCMTDLFDGFLARKLNENTYLGKVLDPIGDFLMIICFSILVYYFDVIKWWFFILVMIRIPGLLLCLIFLMAMDIKFKLKTTFLGRSTIFYILCLIGLSTLKLLLNIKNIYYDIFLFIIQIIGALLIIISSIEKILQLIYYLKNQNNIELKKENIQF